MNLHVGKISCACPWTGIIYNDYIEEDCRKQDNGMNKAKGKEEARIEKK